MVDDMAEAREQMRATETTGLATGLPEQGGSLGVQLTLERRNGSCMNERDDDLYQIIPLADPE